MAWNPYCSYACEANIIKAGPEGSEKPNALASRASAALKLSSLSRRILFYLLLFVRPESPTDPVSSLVRPLIVPEQ